MPCEADNKAEMMGIEPKIAAVLQKRFPNNEVAPRHFGELLVEYAKSALSPPHLLAEILTEDESKLWSYIWEAMLYRHLRASGYELRNLGNSSGQNGPDFGIDQDGRTIWLEAIVPSPNGIPPDWLETPRKGEIRAKSKPDAERVLRCTSAISAKREKFAEYRKKEIVGANDCLVIAVNICRLSDFDIDGTGISQLPLIMEAVFPFGPLAIPITREGKLDGPAQHSPRFTIKKTSGAEIQTGNFLDPRFANVSAVVQAFQKGMFNNDLILSTVHNPLAHIPLPIDLFGAREEFVAEQRGDEYQIKNIAPNRTKT